VDNYRSTFHPVVARRFRWQSFFGLPQNGQLGSHFGRHRRHSSHTEVARDHLTLFVQHQSIE
jgi:hypothetical protein